MFRKALTVVATAAVLGGLATPALAAPAAPAVAASPAAHSRQVDGVTAVSHSNSVTIESPSLGISSMSYSYSGDYSVTDGQPWGGVTNGAGSPNSLSITAQAGRHDSSGPAQFFTSNASAMVGANALSGSPSELNFAFSGTLTLNGTDYDIVLGQGSNSNGNDWWIGGPGWTGGGLSRITSPDGAFTIEADSGPGGNSTFYVYANN